MTHNDDINILHRKFQRAEKARRHAEQLLEARSLELYQSLQDAESNERMLHDAVEAMVEGVLFTDPHDNVLLSNSRLAELYPAIAEKLVKGSNIRGLLPLVFEHPAYAERLKLVRSPTMFTVDTEEGRMIAVSANFTSDGMIVSTHRDVTTEHEVENERRKLLMDAARAQRLESIGRMSKLIAHDFNNIISSIKGYAGFLQDDLSASNCKERNYVRNILKGTDLAEKLITQVLEYGHRQKTSGQVVALLPVLEDVIELCAPELPESVEIRPEFPEEPSWVLGHESRLNQMFSNLLRNAIHALGDRPGRISLVVETFPQLAARSAENHHPDVPGKGRFMVHEGLLIFPLPCVRISILDTGCGMTRDVIKKVFEVYYSTSQIKTHGGLGMPSVLETVRECGGGVRILSKPDHGTTVEIILPLTKPALANFKSRAGAPPSVGDTQSHILVIDDDRKVGELLCEILERAGHLAELMTSATEAHADLLADPGRWHLVVSDQSMPGINGTEIHRSLRDHGIQLPFILVSGIPISEDDSDSAVLMESFLEKPIDPDRLLALVDTLLNG